MHSSKDTARFWSKVNIRGEDECWPWLAANDGKYGYGTFYIGGRNRRASQVAWEIRNNAPFPKGMDACHSCDNPPCANPKHIWAGTKSQNSKDAVRKGRMYLPHEHGQAGAFNKTKVICKRGHPLADDNLIITTQGNRSCRVCQNMHDRNYRARKTQLI